MLDRHRMNCESFACDRHARCIEASVLCNENRFPTAAAVWTLHPTVLRLSLRCLCEAFAQVLAVHDGYELCSGMQI